MTWRRRYRVRFYFRNSLWILPVFSIVLALISVPLVTRFEQAVGSRASVSPETARVIMTTVAASTFTLVVLVSSAVLLAVQLASAQLTPRIIAMVYRSAVLKLAFAFFVFNFTFSAGVLARIENSAPRLASYIAVYGFLASIGLFIYFIDQMGKLLRPSSALRTVALVARKVIRDVYPTVLTEDSPAPLDIESITHEQPRIIRSRIDGALLAFDLKGLVALAETSNCVIELVPQVGQFIAVGDPLFRVYRGGEELPETSLLNSVVKGSERSPEQDPMFAFRIMVDIANRALSPAINDPTTAVLAIDQIHHLLRDIGRRNLAEGQATDALGQVRLLYRTPDWEDFVLLGTTEIRLYGANSIQVQRRLRAMLEDLIDTLPEPRHPLLYKELSLLATASRRSFPDLDDQTLAESADLQGIGGDDELYDEKAIPLVHHN
jgi:uncharacterized membrane protein